MDAHSFTSEKVLTIDCCLWCSLESCRLRTKEDECKCRSFQSRGLIEVDQPRVCWPKSPRYAVKSDGKFARLSSHVLVVVRASWNTGTKFGVGESLVIPFM